MMESNTRLNEDQGNIFRFSDLDGYDVSISGLKCESVFYSINCYCIYLESA